MDLRMLLVTLWILGPPAGLWLLPHRDPANTARADVAGRMRSAPRETWSIGPVRRPIQNAWSVGRDYLTQSGTALERVREDGRRVWIVPDVGANSVIGLLDFGGKGMAALASVGGGNIVLIDLKDGRRVWRWAPPAKAEPGGPILWRDPSGTWRLALFPQNTVEGAVYEFSGPSTAPKALWRQTYTGKYWPNFGPFGVVADMNRDGRPDILLAGKPSYVAAIDGDTGRVLFDLRYTIPDAENEGRPYGLIQATDLDGDGFRDAVVISCQVEEYAAVIRNVGGTRFTLAWAKFVENDLPRDDRELRPNVTSVADIDGDGRKELVVGLFNTDGDGQWHTVAFDALRGWSARKLDLAKRYFWGCYDLNGDGVPEIVTSLESKRRPTAGPTSILVVDGRTGRDRGAFEAELVTPNRPLPRDTAFHAIRATPTLVTAPDGARGLLIRTKTGEQLVNTRLAVHTPFKPSPIARMVAFGTVDDPIERPERTIGSPGGVEPSAFSPRVSFADGRPELVVARSDGTIEGGRPIVGKPGALADAWSVRGVCPALWIGPDGERLVLAFDAARDAYHVYRPTAGQRDAAPIATVPLPSEPYRIPGMLLPFGDALKVYVGMKTGVHTTAGALFDRAGKVVWRDDADGPYPRPAAVVPGSTDPQLVVDNHGKILFYDVAGAKSVVAHGWNATVPGRGDGAKYVLPIPGPFGPGGALRILLASGLENLEILDRTGARLSMTPFGSIYERQFAGSAALRRPDGGWSLGVLTTRGVFHCTDLNDGKDRWRIDLERKPTYPTRTVCADIDGDGVEEFLVGLADGSVVALAEIKGSPKELWRFRLDAAIRDLAVGDVDGDGLADLIVESDDGKVRLFGAERKR